MTTFTGEILNGKLIFCASEDIVRKFKSLEDSGLLITGVSKTIRNKAKEQKCSFLSRLLVALGASLSGNMLAGKEANRADAGVNRAGQDFQYRLIF